MGKYGYSAYNVLSIIFFSVAIFCNSTLQNLVAPYQEQNKAYSHYTTQLRFLSLTDPA